MWKEALTDFDALLAANPQDPLGLRNRGCVRREMAESAAGQGKEWRPLLEQAIADFDALLRKNPGNADGRVQRAEANLSLGMQDSARGGDPRERYRLALADGDAALAIDASQASAWFARGSIRLAVAVDRQARKEDSSADYEQAIADLSAALRCDPGDREALLQRGNVLMFFAGAEAARDVDPKPRLDRAIADFAAALAIDPRSANDWFLRGWARVTRARAEEEPSATLDRALADLDEAVRRNPAYWQAVVTKAAAFELLHDYVRAVAEYDAALKIRPGDARTVKWRAQAALRLAAAQGPDAWRRELGLGDTDVRSGDYRSARSHYERGFALLDGLGAEEHAAQWKDPGTPGALQAASYNLGCIYALLTIGRDGPQAAPGAVSPADATRARDAAFAILGRAVDSGWKDAKHVAEDPDLAPLHADPRWAPLLERMGKAGPK